MKPKPIEQVTHAIVKDSAQPVSPAPVLWTVEDVANYLRLESETIRNMARRGNLPAIKIGRVWRFNPDHIRAWLQQNPEQP